MKIGSAILILIACAAVTRADQTVTEAQQSLKDQGFYYGEVTGEKNADTTAAIRRYQIRNGLQITGELDEQTVKSLRSVPSTSTPPPVTTATVAPLATTPLPRQESTEETEPNDSEPAQPYAAPPQDRSALGGYPNAPVVQPRPTNLLANTPYESAPPEEQRDIFIDAQRALASHGFYHGAFDGVYSTEMQFSLRAYQSRFRLPVTGRLDLDTLAALELLPGAKAPVYRPRHRRLIPRMRGEWIRP
jgi:peptidoglycan hydrolase-like protein with peptidoglycan-binding domain